MLVTESRIKGWRGTLRSLGGEAADYYTSIVERYLKEKDDTFDPQDPGADLVILFCDDPVRLAQHSAIHLERGGCMIEVWASSLSTVKVRCHRTVFETFSPGSYFAVQLIDYIEWVTAKFSARTRYRQSTPWQRGGRHG